MIKSKSVAEAVVIGWMVAVCALPSAGQETTGQWMPRPASTRVIRPGESFASITNKVCSAPPRTLIHIQKAPYWIPTNLITWRRPGVDFFLEPGTRLAFGTFGDAAAEGERPVFSDVGVEASTTRIVAWGAEITVSNRFSHLFHQTNHASELILNVHDLGRYDSGTGGALFKIARGRFSCFGTGLATNWGYDFFWTEALTNALRVNGYYARVDVTDNAFELAGVLPGLCEWRFGTLRSANSMALASNWVIHANQTLGGWVTVTEAIADIAHAPILNTSLLDGGGNSAVQMDGNGKLKIVGAKIRSTGAMPIDLNLTDGTATPPQLVLANCEIESDQTYAISSSVVGTSRVDVVGGGLTVNRPIEPYGSSGALGPNTIHLYGGPVIGPPYTNNYAGTNVTLSVAAQQNQVVIVTNSMLIVWTNVLESGRGGNVVLVNNKATNMNVAHTTANVRFMGGASNTVAAGKSLAIAYEIHGTNLFLSFAPQTN